MFRGIIMKLANIKKLITDVQRMQNGDASAFCSIRELTEPYVHKLIYDIIQKRDVTEELSARVYEIIREELPALEYPHKIFDWVGQLSTDVCAKYLIEHNLFNIRSQVATGNNDFIPETAIGDKSILIPESILTDTNFQQSVINYASSLTPAQKVIVQYYYYEYISITEISNRLNKSAALVKHELTHIKKDIINVLRSGYKIEDNTFYLEDFPILHMLFLAELYNEPLEEIYKDRNKTASHIQKKYINNIDNDDFATSEFKLNDVNKTSKLAIIITFILCISIILFLTFGFFIFRFNKTSNKNNNKNPFDLKQFENIPSTDSGVNTDPANHINKPDSVNGILLTTEQTSVE